MLKIMEAFSNASENCEVGLAVKASYLSECQMNPRGERQRGKKDTRREPKRRMNTYQVNET